MARWVCLRCFASNEEAFAACQSCGLPRGEQPAAEDGPFPVAAEETSPGGRWIQRLGRFWWVILVVAVSVGGLIFNAQRDDDGSISRSGNLAISDLRVGDCFDLKGELDEDEAVDEITARPCTEPHEFELMHIGTVASATYPADAAFVTWLDENCLPAFAEYIGRSYSESALDVFWFQPTREGWDAGDHSVQCAVFDPANDELTGALRGAAR
ncbi:MAG TPA: septum formation family protein [Candidatus Limnocylindria bacterium]|jgi:hypothetical protein